MAITCGTPITGLAISTKTAAGRDVSYTVAVGDALKKVVIRGSITTGEDVTLDSAVFRGVTLRGRRVPRGATTVFDSTPIYMADPNGENGFYGTVDETSEARDLLLETTSGEGDDAVTTRRLYPINNILSIDSVVAAKEDDSTNH